MRHGSLVNHLGDQSNAAHGAAHVWKVGDGATILCWTDRHACTVIAVEARTFTIQRDNATRNDGRGMSDSQSYTYTPNPAGETYAVKLTKKGWVTKCGRSVVPGRDEHYDFSF